MQLQKTSRRLKEENEALRGLLVRLGYANMIQSALDGISGSDDTSYTSQAPVGLTGPGAMDFGGRDNRNTKSKATPQSKRQRSTPLRTTKMKKMKMKRRRRKKSYRNLKLPLKEELFNFQSTTSNKKINNGLVKLHIQLQLINQTLLKLTTHTFNLTELMRRVIISMIGILVSTNKFKRNRSNSSNNVRSKKIVNPTKLDLLVLQNLVEVDL